MDGTLDRLTLRRSTVGRCPSCGNAVLVEEDFATVNGRAYHAACLPERVEERAYRQLYDRSRGRVRLRNGR
jgi:hypothetical protein